MSDLREALTAALEGEESEAVEAVETETEPVESTTDTPPAEEPEEGSVRDALGRFVSKSGKAETQEEGDNPPAAVEPPVPDQSAVATAPTAAAAPQSWGPALRDKWGTLPPEVQQQVVQRETQMQRWANETAPARQMGEQFMQAVQPFQHAITAEGVDPITAVKNLMQVGATLRFGTPGEKATTLARLVKAYGVDIQALDSALVGETPQNTQGVDQQTIQAMVQQQLAPLYQAAQARQEQSRAQAQQEARQTLQAFEADPKNEYYRDVSPIMADLIEVAERNGQQLSLAEAYRRATMLHPDVSRVILAKQQGANAQTLTAAARKAKASAVSIKGLAPAGNPGKPEPSSIREGIEAAIEAHSGY